MITIYLYTFWCKNYFPGLVNTSWRRNRELIRVVLSALVNDIKPIPESPPNICDETIFIKQVEFNFIITTCSTSCCDVERVRI